MEKLHNLDPEFKEIISHLKECNLALESLGLRDMKTTEIGDSNTL